MLRAPRAGGVRKRLRSGELSARAACELDPAEVMLSEEQLRKRQDRREREARGIESVRITNFSDPNFKCVECGGTQGIKHELQSMGLETAATTDRTAGCTARTRRRRRPRTGATEASEARGGRV